jgi:hypothetical protein
MNLFPPSPRNVCRLPSSPDKRWLLAVPTLPQIEDTRMIDPPPTRSIAGTAAHGMPCPRLIDRNRPVRGSLVFVEQPGHRADARVGDENIKFAKTASASETVALQSSGFVTSRRR